MSPYYIKYTVIQFSFLQKLIFCILAHALHLNNILPPVPDFLHNPETQFMILVHHKGVGVCSKKGITITVIFSIEGGSSLYKQMTYYFYVVAYSSWHFTAKNLYLWLDPRNKKNAHKTLNVEKKSSRCWTWIHECLPAYCSTIRRGGDRIGL